MRTFLFLMVQDDVVFCRNVRSYLEQSLWPAPTLGVITLYDPHENHVPSPGFQPVTSRDGLSGALALAFPNAAARLLLSDPHVLAHRRRGPADGTRLIDVMVGKWAHRSGLGAFGHTPSLVQHIGDRTTLWRASGDAFPRRSESFVGEQFDACEFVRPVEDQLESPCGAN